MARELPRDLGQYRLVEKLGAGGMGVVYRAIDTVLDRPVAIKMMLGLDALGDDANVAEIRERFLREARAAARIKSRFIAQVIQLGTSDDGEVYIVMELLAGKALSKVMSQSHRAGGPMAPERVVHIVRQICRGMQAAHDLGVIHRDLKPANIMLIDEDGDPDTAKILDFGVAKLTNDEQTRGLTQAGALLGTLPFMSPEQLASGTIDARSDIYALGVVLYRMFTGVSVWEVESLSDIVRHQLSAKPPSMFERVTNPRFPIAVDGVVLRCLEKAPEKRWQSMRELGDALDAAMRDVPDVHTAPSVPAAVGTNVDETFTELSLAPATTTRPTHPGVRPGPEPDVFATMPMSSPASSSPRSAATSAAPVRPQTTSRAIAAGAPALTVPGPTVAVSWPLAAVVGIAIVVVAVAALVAFQSPSGSTSVALAVAPSPLPPVEVVVSTLEPAVEPAVKPAVEPAVEPAVKSSPKPGAKPPVAASPVVPATSDKAPTTAAATTRLQATKPVFKRVRTTESP
jgi:serine/threonine protein kinase